MTKGLRFKQYIWEAETGAIQDIKTTALEHRVKKITSMQIGHDTLSIVYIMQIVNAELKDRGVDYSRKGNNGKIR